MILEDMVLDSIFSSCKKTVNSLLDKMSEHEYRQLLKTDLNPLIHPKDIHYYCQVCGKDLKGNRAIISRKGIVYCPAGLEHTISRCAAEGLIWKEGKTGYLPEQISLVGQYRLLYKILTKKVTAYKLPEKR